MEQFNEDDLIQDLMKAQLTNDPSHGGKLVKKQITDKNGKKTTKWVSQQEAEQIDKQGQEKQQDTTESIKYIDSLPVEEKAKLELVKEHIDSGDMTTAKELADGLSDEAKQFIPKDIWKDIHSHKEEESEIKEVYKFKGSTTLQKPNQVLDLERALGIKFELYEKTGSLYGNYNSKMIRLSNHPSKFTEKNENAIDLDYNVDSPLMMYSLITGKNRFEDVKKGDKIKHKRLGDMEFMSYNLKDKRVEVKNKEGETKNYDDSMFDEVFSENIKNNYKKGSETVELDNSDIEWAKDTKVVDDNGKPMVVKLGISSNSKDLDINGLFGKGIYFSNNQNIINKNISTSIENYGGEESVSDAIINIKNPYIIKHTVNFLDEFYGESSESIQKTLINRGHDGIIYENKEGENTYIVFDKRQIRFKNEDDKKDKRKDKRKDIKKSEMGIIGKIKNKIVNFFKSEDEKGKSSIYGDVICIDMEGNILLLQRSKSDKIEPGKWWLPGGHIEENEDPKIGAFRELVEETNLEGDLYHISTKEKNGKTFHYYVTLVEEKDKLKLIIDNDEHFQYEWLNPISIANKEILMNQYPFLIDLIGNAKKMIAFNTIKEAFEQNKVNEDVFLKALMNIRKIN